MTTPSVSATGFSVKPTYMDDRNVGTLRAIVTVKGVSTALTPIATVTPAQPSVTETANKMIAKHAAGNTIEINGIRFGSTTGDLSVVFSPVLPSPTVVACYDTRILVTVGDTTAGSLYGNLSVVVTRSGADSGAGVVVGRLVAPSEPAPTITNPVLDFTVTAPVSYSGLTSSVEKSSGTTWVGAFSTSTFVSLDVQSGANSGVEFKCTVSDAAAAAAQALSVAATSASSALQSLVAGLSDVRSAKSDHTDIPFSFMCRSDGQARVRECTGGTCSFPNNNLFSYVPSATVFKIIVNAQTDKIEYLMDNQIVYRSLDEDGAGPVR